MNGIIVGPPLSKSQVNPTVIDVAGQVTENDDTAYAIHQNASAGVNIAHDLIFAMARIKTVLMASTNIPGVVKVVDSIEARWSSIIQLLGRLGRYKKHIGVVLTGPSATYSTLRLKIPPPTENADKLMQSLN